MSGIFDRIKKLFSQPKVEKKETTKLVQAAESKKKQVGMLNLYIPLTGEVKDLSEVPDQVFANKLIGEGIAIMPQEGLVVAPCDGKVLQIFPTNHAIGIETAAGIDLLIHVGIDTVELKGEGFMRLVEEGQTVKKGDPLLQVDLDSVKAAGKPIITPFIISNADEAEVQVVHQGEGQAGQVVVMNVKRK